MRLTDRGGDPEDAIAVLHAALDTGVRLLDTADVYGAEPGANERLVARALATWDGNRDSVVVATKGGLTRPAVGRWLPDGRAKHLERACAASAVALGIERIELYQLHAVDPKTPIERTVRALARLRERGLVRDLGLCNVNVGQIEAARAIVPIASVQVAVNPLDDSNLRNGVVSYCVEHGIRLIAHSPFGGPRGEARIGRHPGLRAVAERLGCSNHELALAWLLDLHRELVAIPGATRPETVRSCATAASLELGDEDRAELDLAFPAGVQVRRSRAERAPPSDATGEVVLLMGYPGAGKTTAVAELVDAGYQRLNRDLTGGKLRDLLPLLESGLAGGQRRFVLDNTYPSRRARNEVIELAWRHGVPVRCVWLDTSLEDSQVNACVRMVRDYGRLLGPEEMGREGRTNPNAFPPRVQFRYRSELEPPVESEGFRAVERRPFVRAWGGLRGGSAVLCGFESLIRSVSGSRAPLSADDVELVAETAASIARARVDGGRTLLLAWYPEVEAGDVTPEALDAVFARVRELCGADLEVEIAYCPHAAGPPRCWCRKPLPGLAVELVERHRLAPASCVWIGGSAADRTLATRLGMALGG